MVLATVGSTPTFLTLNEHLLQVISENKKEKESDTKMNLSEKPNSWVVYYLTPTEKTEVVTNCDQLEDLYYLIISMLKVEKAETKIWGNKEEPSKIDQQIQNNFEFNLWKLEVPLCIYFILKWVEIIFNLMSK